MNNRFKVNTYSIGLFMLFFYIFTSYIASDVIISSKWNSFSLYSFIGITAFFYFVGLYNNNWILRITTYTKWYGLFIIMSLLTMIYSPEKSLSSGQMYMMIVSFILTTLISFLIRNEKDFIKIGLFYASSAVILNIILFLTGHLTGSSVDRLGTNLMGNANIYATMIMIAVMYACWLYVYWSPNFIIKILILLSLLMNMYSLILSGGRKFFVIPFVYLYLLLVFKKNKKGRKQVIKYSFLALIAIVLIYYLILTIPIFYDTIGYRMEALINGAVGYGSYDNSAYIRKIIRNLAFNGWMENPFLGHGFDSFKYLNVKITGHFYYSHCNYTEILYNEGIFIFLFYYGYFFYLILKAFQTNLSDKYKAFICSGIISFLVFDLGAVSYSLYVIQIMISLMSKIFCFDESNKINKGRK